jgi:preprotein translocase subunit SecE
LGVQIPPRLPAIARMRMEWNPAVWYSESRQFIVEVRSEFRKVTWPTQKEAMAGTIGVLIVVTVLTTALGLVDLGLGQLIRLILPS